MFVMLLLGFSPGGAMVLWLWQSVGFCGLGLQLGLAAGCLAYAVIKASGSAESQFSDFKFDVSSPRLLAVALLSALIMHLVETGFAFPTASTATLFWAFAGVLVALERQARLLPHPDADASATVQAPEPREMV